MTRHSAPPLSCLSLTATRGSSALRNPPEAAPKWQRTKGVVRAVTLKEKERTEERRCRSTQLFLSNKIRSSFYLFLSRLHSEVVVVARRRGGEREGGAETNSTIQAGAGGRRRERDWVRVRNRLLVAAAAASSISIASRGRAMLGPALPSPPHSPSRPPKTGSPLAARRIPLVRRCSSLPPSDILCKLLSRPFNLPKFAARAATISLSRMHRDRPTDSRHWGTNT